MAVGDPSSERTLEFTPTWALATVATVFILVSIAVERSLHALGHYLHRSKRKPLEMALQKLKDELMLMGFISLTITIITTPVSKICIQSSKYNKWTPCDIKLRPKPNTTYTGMDGGRRRLLAAVVGSSYCDEGMEPFVSYNTLHQLHILIFVLACVHVTYSCLVMVLSLAKIYTWGKWEREAHEAVAQHNMRDFSNSVSACYSRQSTFVRYHSSTLLGLKFLSWLGCFFKQFYVRRADYLTLRLSFITTHNLRDNYNFHAYMIRCMEDEFESLIGISIWLWGFVIGNLLFSVTEPIAHFWASLVPALVVLTIGMKLQHVMTTLAQEHSGVNGPFVGVLLKPRDQLFWFNKPRFLLFIIHFILFESTFELATFIWHVWQFDFKTCLLDDNKAHLYIRLLLGITTQLLCCFVTLPLYALVSQMSSMPKKAFLPKRVMRGLKQWHKDAQTRLSVKVMQAYQTQRLAKKAITPLDHQHFLHFHASGGGLLAPTHAHAHAMSSPMNIIMEEGTSTTNKGTGDGAQDHPENEQASSSSSVFLMSGSHVPNESKGNMEISLLGHQPADLRKRAPSPRGAMNPAMNPAMNLNIPPFQRPPPSPAPKPLQRSLTSNN